MNSTNIFNIRKKRSLVKCMAFLPKVRILEIIQDNKRLQKLLRIKEVMYKIYSLKNSKEESTFILSDYEDNHTKREILNSLLEISNLPFLKEIGFSFKEHTKRISGITKLPPLEENQNLIASFSYDNYVILWDIAKKSKYLKLNISRSAIIIAVIPWYNATSYMKRKSDLKIMAITSDKGIIIFDIRKKELLEKDYLKPEKEFIWNHFGNWLCAIKVDEKRFATTSYENYIKIWEINEENNLEKCWHVWKGHTAAVQMVITLSDGRLASCSWDTTVKIWDLTEYKCEWTINDSVEKILNIVELKGNKLGMCSANGEIKIWNLKLNDNNEPTCEFSFEGNDFMYELADGRLATGLFENEFQIVNLNELKIDWIFKTDHSEKISGFTQWDDGRIVSTSFDTKINVYGFVNYKEMVENAQEYDYTYNNGCLYITYLGNSLENGD